MGGNSSSQPPSDDACSMPSLSISADDYCSMPSLSISTVNIGSGTLSISGSTSFDGATHRQVIHGDVAGDELGVSVSSDGGEESNWISRIQQEMLQVAAERSNIAGRESFLFNRPTSAAPYLRTAECNSRRQKNAQSRLLREADLQILSEPMKFPVYKAQESAELKLPQQQTKAKKKVVPESNTASRGTQCLNTKQARETATQTKKTPSMVVRNKSTKQDGNKSSRPKESDIAALAARDKPFSKTENSAQCDGYPLDTVDKSNAEDATECEHETHSVSLGQPKTDESLYRVMAVSSPKPVQMNMVPAKPVVANDRGMFASMSSGKQEGHNSYVVPEIAKGELKQNGPNNIRVPDRHAIEADSIGAGFSFCTARAPNHQPIKTEETGTTSAVVENAYGPTCISNIGQERCHEFVTTLKGFTCPKVCGGGAEMCTDNVYAAQAQSNSRKYDGNEYENKLSSLENELRGIRHLLEDTKSKRSNSSREKHVPSSIAVPANHGEILPNSFAFPSPATRSSSTISSIARSRCEPSMLQCKSKLFYASDNRRCNSKNEFVPGSFSPSSSWRDNESLSFVEKRRRPRVSLPKKELLLPKTRR